jgi:signal transduction histidine kinase
MPETVWYKSLYWRIALGFVALLATLLAVQGLVFLWLTGRTAEFLPGRSPAELAQAIARDVAVTLVERPDVDLDVHLNERFNSSYRPYAVVIADGRVISSRRIPPPLNAARAAIGRLYSAGAIDRASSPFGPGAFGPSGRSDGRGPDGFDRERRGGPDRGPGAGPGPGGGSGRGSGRGGPGGVPLEFAAITLADRGIVGMVAVPVDPPPLSLTLRRFGPTFAAIAIGLLIAGTAIAAIVIFGPSRRRLRSLQQAARALGAGQLDVRAAETGGDEVASLARAFNEMADGLEERSRALATANETRKQLLADVSHELMTPLAAIRGYVETMAMPDLALDDATRQRYLEIVGVETERLEHIIGDLLDLARLEGGGGALKREPVSTSALFERVLHRHDPALRAKQITLDAQVAPGAESVHADPNRLEQVLQNLAANAVRHTPEGGRITLSADPAPDGGVRIAVEDTGSGIPPEHLARVFDRFYKVDVSRTGTTLPSGSGLGLSIVQAIVERHGGRISASNGERGGARFEILLGGHGQKAEATVKS